MELKNSGNNGNYYSDASGQQNPYGQNPYSQNAYGQQGTYDQNPYGQQNAYNQSQYGQQDYYSNSQYNNQNPYGQQSQYGQSPYGQNMNNGSGYYDNTQPAYQNGSSVGAALGAAVLNSVMTKAFLYMFMALLITGITALCVASSPDLIRAFWMGGSVPFIVCAVAEFGLVIACQAAINKNNLMLSCVLFCIFAIVNGFTFSVIFLAFQLSSIVSVFFMTALIFGIMSVFGAVTKKDMTSLGSILLAGLIGIIIGSVINMFLGSAAVDYLVTIIGIIVFVLFTAYDVNKIKKLANSYTGLSDNVIALYGAMNLYLDFINLFLKLLRLFGKRK